MPRVTASWTNPERPRARPRSRRSATIALSIRSTTSSLSGYVRVRPLRTFDGLERLEVQLYRAGVNVEQIAAMTQRGEWADDADFAELVTAQASSDSREVAVALAVLTGDVD